jgi:hypothetical protein
LPNNSASLQPKRGGLELGAEGEQLGFGSRNRRRGGAGWRCYGVRKSDGRQDRRGS